MIIVEIFTSLAWSGHNIDSPTHLDKLVSAVHGYISMYNKLMSYDVT